MKTLLAATCLLTVLSGSQVLSQNIAPKSANESSSSMVLMSEVEWGALNPARGEKGPRAANLWGDRTGPGPTGFLVKFVDGFSSPPHIHNVTYRGMVISGLVHNDDPDAESMWMPPGSFWTQPAGQVHITSARGVSIAYIEIEGGPYLVRPSKEAFDDGERPVNVDEANIVWLDASTVRWLDEPGKPAAVNGPKLAFLWGAAQDNQLNGTLLKLPAGFSGNIQSHGSGLRAVVIKGRLDVQLADEAGSKTLEPGSYFGSHGKATHQVSNETGEECILYVRMEGKYEVVSTQPGK